jgi:hypothetical protein
MLEIGLQIDTDAEGLDADLRQKLAAEFKTDLSLQKAPLLMMLKQLLHCLMQMHL